MPIKKTLKIIEVGMYIDIYERERERNQRNKKKTKTREMLSPLGNFEIN